MAIGETIRSVPGVGFAADKLNGFAITGDNKTSGPPITSDADYESLCVAAVPPPGFQVTRGSKWHYGAPGHSMYNHRRTPNAPFWNQLSLNVTARSRHPGGVQVLFADGHAQFIKDSVSLMTWRALGSVRGGEVIGAESY